MPDPRDLDTELRNLAASLHSTRLDALRLAQDLSDIEDEAADPTYTPVREPIRNAAQQAAALTRSLDSLTDNALKLRIRMHQHELFRSAPTPDEPTR